MSEFINGLPASILRDLMNAACGVRLGRGIGRDVFVYDLNPRFVIKVERSGFQNVVEWEVWKAVKGTPFEKWFAPVRHISGLGTVLLMDRTLPASRSRYPKRMPVFLGDYKFSNYGLLNGRIVAHDYGSMVNISNGLTKKMRRAEWWDAEDGSTFNDGSRS
jgi:hypothetical protein